MHRHASIVASLVLGACRFGFDPIAHDGSIVAGDGPHGLGDGAGGCVPPNMDGFDDGVPGPSWRVTAAPGVTVSETGGVLQIDLAGADNVASGGYETICTNDLVGHALIVEVPLVTTSATSSTQLDAYDVANCLQLGGMTATQSTVMFAPGSGSIAYDAAMMRWWKVAFAATTVTFSTSPDGVAFTQRHQSATQFAALGATIFLTAFQGVGAGTARFDNFRIE